MNKIELRLDITHKMAEGLDVEVNEELLISCLRTIYSWPIDGRIKCVLLDMVTVGVDELTEYTKTLLDNFTFKTQEDLDSAWNQILKAFPKTVARALGTSS